MIQAASRLLPKLPMRVSAVVGCQACPPLAFCCSAKLIQASAISSSIALFAESSEVCISRKHSAALR